MDDLLAAANKRNTFQINFDFVIAWQAIIILIILLFVTVWMSAWVPAQKAANMAAIDVIRVTGEVKIKAKNVRGGRLIGKLFGFEGILAYKSLKRSRRNFCATVMSLTVSIMLFIVVGSFGAQYKETTRLYYPGVENVNVVCTFLSPQDAKPDDGRSETKDHKYTKLDSFLADEITLKLREYPNTKVLGVGDNVMESNYNSYKVVIPKEMLTSRMLEFLNSDDYVPAKDGYLLPVTLCITDSENYVKLCKRVGVPLSSNILVNYARIPDGDCKGKSIFAPFEFTPKTSSLTDYYNNSNIELSLDGELDIRYVPNEIAVTYVGNVTVIVPQLTSD